MVGNVWEWVGMWSGANASEDTASTSEEFHADGQWSVLAAPGGNAGNLPAAGMRGGDWSTGTSAGVFALNFENATSHVGMSIGARCCIGH